jgi:hypothetical protein
MRSSRLLMRRYCGVRPDIRHREICVQNPVDGLNGHADYVKCLQTHESIPPCLTSVASSPIVTIPLIELYENVRICETLFFVHQSLAPIPGTPKMAA